MRFRLLVFFLFLMLGAEARYAMGFRNVSLLGVNSVRAGYGPMYGLELQYDRMIFTCTNHKKYLGASIGYAENDNAKIIFVKGMYNPIRSFLGLTMNSVLVPYILIDASAVQLKGEAANTTLLMKPGIGLTYADLSNSRFRIRAKTDMGYLIPTGSSNTQSGFYFGFGFGFGFGFWKERRYRPACVLPSF